MTRRTFCTAALLLAGAAGCDSTRSSMDADYSAARASRVFVQRERLGNPLVSEVLLQKARHQAFNTGRPSTDPADFGAGVTAFVTGVAGREASVAVTLNAVLLPDLLIAYPERNPATAGW